MRSGLRPGGPTSRARPHASAGRLPEGSYTEDIEEHVSSVHAMKEKLDGTTSRWIRQRGLQRPEMARVWSAQSMARKSSVLEARRPLDVADVVLESRVRSETREGVVKKGGEPSCSDKPPSSCKSFLPACYLGASHCDCERKSWPSHHSSREKCNAKGTFSLVLIVKPTTWRIM